MSHPSATYLSLPWTDAIAFFRDKVSLPTERWDDLWAGMHSRAFVVAGAMKAELLADLRMAVDKAISQGTTLAEFRKDFDKIVERHGWQYKGGRGWRTSIIYGTNIATARDAAEHAAMTAPEVLVAFPYWRYMPSTSANPREEHKRWYGIVLPHDHPWWRTHRPRNGWHCKCDVMPISEREYQRLRNSGDIKTEPPDDGTYEYVNKKTGEVSQVPVGIDPGWDYNPGEAAWGRRLSEAAMKEFQAMKADAWESLTPGNWQTHGLPSQLIPGQPKAELGPKLTTKEAAVESLEKVIGGPEAIYSVAAKGVRHDLLVNAETLVDHLDLARTPFLPFIPESLANPDEIWMRFDRHKGTGQVVLRTRIIKALSIGAKKGVLVVFNARNGMLEAWTMMPIDKQSYVNLQRSGVLAYIKGKVDGEDGQDAAASPAPYDDI